MVYDTSTGSWTSQTVTGDVNGTTGGSLSQVSTGTGLGFAFAAPTTADFITFNVSDPNLLRWRNMTTPGAQGISVPAISADNALVFVPLGDQGILVLFGAGYLVRHPPFPSPHLYTGRKLTRPI